MVKLQGHNAGKLFIHKNIGIKNSLEKRGKLENKVSFITSFSKNSLSLSQVKAVATRKIVGE